MVRALLLVVFVTSSAIAEEDPITHAFLATGGRTSIYEPAAPRKASVEAAATPPRQDMLFEDFEQPDYAGWVTTGTAFGDGPVVIKEIPAYQGDVGGRGERLVNSHFTRDGGDVRAGDAHVGTLTSEPFTIQRRYITALVGGGPHAAKTCMNVLIDGQPVVSVTGHSHNRMRLKLLDVSDHQGKEARLQIVDQHKAGWGNIGVDHIVFTDTVPDGLAGAGQGAGGRIVWSYLHPTRDGWVLDNGNVLLALANSRAYPGGGVIEVTRKGKVVFEYKGTQKELQAVQPLEGGRVLVVEGGANPRLLELSRTGAIEVEIPLQCQKKHIHMQSRMARKLKNGNYLVPHLLDFAVKEYAPDGKVLRVIPTDQRGRDVHDWPFTAIRLDNGNTLIGCTHGNRVIEVDGEGKIVWQITNDDLPTPMIADACGVQRLPNGNTVIASYRVGPGGLKLLEVTPDKKVVWTFREPTGRGIHHFQILTTNGKPIGDRTMK